MPHPPPSQTRKLSQKVMEAKFAVDGLLDLHKQQQILESYPRASEETQQILRCLAGRLMGKTGATVYSGPFSGMSIPKDSPLAELPLYVLGCYEQELHPALYQVIANPPEDIIIIGSAHGYYSVGLATQTHDTRITAFEAEPSLWPAAQKLAEENGVPARIAQQATCTIDSLRKSLSNHSFILSDCEGAELDLLDPEKIPLLKKSHILCEVHDFYIPGITPTLIHRFRGSHHITLIEECSRDPFRYRILDGMNDFEKTLAVREIKYTKDRVAIGKFLWMTPPQDR